MAKQSSYAVAEINSVSIKKNVTEIRYTMPREGGHPGTDEFVCSSSDPAHPHLKNAMQQLKERCAEAAEVSADKSFTVYKVAFHRRNQLLTAACSITRTLRKSKKVQTLNVPPFREGLGANNVLHLGDEMMDQLGKVIDEARAYLGGKRAQLSMDD